MKTNRLFIILLIVGALLLIPLIAVQISDEVNWSAFDFLFGSILLGGTGLLIDFALRKISHKQNRFIAIGVILAVVFLVWAELAVGVFVTPFAGS